MMADPATWTPPRWGRLPRAFGPVPHMSALLQRPGLPPIPTALDYTGPLPADQGMDGNDQIGDCTAAFVAHAIQVWSRYAGGTEIVIPRALAIQFYTECTGYDGTPATDRGAVIQDVLAHWMNVGFPMPDGSRNRLHGYVEIDPRQLDDVERAVYECGVLDVGMAVPAWLEQAPPPDVWDDAPGLDTTAVGGHCVGYAGYQRPQQLLRTMSWGRDYDQTAAFEAQQVDEIYACVNPLWVEATGRTPLGMTLDFLAQQMAPLRFGG